MLPMLTNKERNTHIAFAWASFSIIKSFEILQIWGFREKEITKKVQLQRMEIKSCSSIVI